MARICDRFLFFSDTRVKYIAPLVFEQRIYVVAELKEFENRLRIGYQIFDADSGKRTTTGYTVQVAVTAETKELCFVSLQVLRDEKMVSFECVIRCQDQKVSHGRLNTYQPDQQEIKKIMSGEDE